MPSIKSIGYSLHFGEEALKALSRFLDKQKYSSVFILCDENTLRCCLPQLMLNCPKLTEAQLIEIESGESAKSISICEQIWQTLFEQEADKQSLLINLGGGVISDLGGFVASVFKRGIDFIHVPTSLLAMADASVGGKTGIDVMGIKNSIGNFTPPKAVFIYPPFLKTLKRKQVMNGWVEIFKIALVSDKKFWELLKKSSYEKIDGQLILRSIELKNKIVLKDPFDRSKRKILNFGHSIGHAIESLLLGTDQELLHGEAVCIGMMVESRLAYQKKLISKKEQDEILNTLSQIFQPDLKLMFSFESILEQLKQDKKNKTHQFMFALVNSIGSCSFDEKVSESQIKKALNDQQLLSL